MFHILTILLWSVLGAFACFPPGSAAVQAPSSVPALDQLIEMHIRALGGRAELTTAAMLALRGECESSNPEESGPIEIDLRTPKVYYNLGNGALQMGYDGDSLWRRTEGEGLRQQRGRQFAQFVTVFDVARVLWWKEWYPEMAVKGVQRLGDKDAYVIQVHPARAGSEMLFIDRQSSLLVRDELMPGLVFTFSDYREIQGVQVPFTIKQTGPGSASYTYRIQKASRVTTSDESRFQPR